LLKALAGWARLELAEGWRSWFGANATKPLGQKQTRMTEEPAPAITQA
jgi:hypothetical protein